ncbi:MAG: hypothetical protein HDT16_01550 [Oscillibacter sp.]|nr:hypothetical protein [Oscillibacter sp.]
MLEGYWQTFVDIKIAEEYYFQYVHHSRHRVGAINVLSLLVTFSGIVTWVNAYLPPLCASIIILFAQILSALQPIYPFGDRLYASQRIYEQMRKLSLTAEQTINQVQFGRMDESDLPASLKELQIAFASIEEDLASPDLFPRNNRLHQKAEDTALQYLKSHFNFGGLTNE